MPRRITKAFFAAAAAGATITTLGFAAASPAGATVAGKHSHPRYFTPTGGTPIPTAANCVISTPAAPSDNCAMAGYQATGRTFRFAQALITVPNHVGVVDPDSATTEPDPQMYVALDNSSTATYEFARVGIAPCPTGTSVKIVPNQSGTTSCGTNPSGWVAFTAVQQPTGTPTISVNNLSTAVMGDGILVNAYLEPTGNAVHFTTTLPNGTVINNVVTVSGPVYAKATAVADWTTAVINGGADDPAMPDVPAAKIRDTQFFQGRFTTTSGARGTFSGPWTTTALEATSNGSLPPAGTLIAQPSYLWNDGNGFQGMGNDAFGIWRFPF
jgi:hypothetical protein